MAKSNDRDNGSYANLLCGACLFPLIRIIFSGQGLSLAKGDNKQGK